MVWNDCCPILTGADRFIPRVFNEDVESGRAGTITPNINGIVNRINADMGISES